MNATATSTQIAPAGLVPTITPDQLELVRTTIARGATDDELRLFLFDCQRQGVHPLDKLIHFTKRAGKYTPITSIDFMRQRAAETKECAGIDDAIFTGDPKTSAFTASVAVWRLVQGQRCAFTATARWTEYKPDQDFMWQKMPHVMLSKVAEALALRKGFPQQLAGLYATEELDQAERRPLDCDPVTGEILGPTSAKRVAPRRRTPVKEEPDLVKRVGQTPAAAPIATPTADAITGDDWRRLGGIRSFAHWTQEEVRAHVLETYGLEKMLDLTRPLFDELCTYVQQHPRADVDDIPF